MKNKEIKKQLLENGSFTNYRLERKKAFQSGKFEEMDISSLGLNSLELSECEKLRQNKSRQRKKIEDHITFLFEVRDYVIVFGTFTFSDNTLEKTKFETRKRYVINALSQFEDYIVNVDYGTKNEREHYHAIIAIKKSVWKKNELGKLSQLENYEKKYGFYYLQEIHKSEKDAKKLAQYVSKLTLHSVKVEQHYVSVKKGSLYQRNKKNYEAIWKADPLKKGNWQAKKLYYREKAIMTITSSMPEKPVKGYIEPRLLDREIKHNVRK